MSTYDAAIDAIKKHLSPPPSSSPAETAIVALALAMILLLGGIVLSGVIGPPLTW
jgi:hypothetical protein